MLPILREQFLDDLFLFQHDYTSENPKYLKAWVNQKKKPLGLIQEDSLDQHHVEHQCTTSCHSPCVRNGMLLQLMCKGKYLSDFGKYCLLVWLRGFTTCSSLA